MAGGIRRQGAGTSAARHGLDSHAAPNTKASAADEQKTVSQAVCQSGFSTRRRSLIVGGNDIDVLRLNQAAKAALAGEVRLEIVPGARHLLEEPGALERGELARDWFLRHLTGPGS